MTTYNPVLVGKLLNMAGHKATGDHEALIAVRKASSHVASAGKSLGDIADMVESEMFLELAALPPKKYLAQLADLTLDRDRAVSKMGALQKIVDKVQLMSAELTAKVEALTLRNASLEMKTIEQEAAIADLTGKADALRAKLAERPGTVDHVDCSTETLRANETSVSSDTLVENGYEKLRDFVFAHNKKVGLPYWRQYLVDEGVVDLATLNVWADRKSVPLWAFHAIPSLSQRAYERKPWSFAENNRFRELAEGGSSLDQIAQIMRDEFNRSPSILTLKKRYNEISTWRQAA